MKLGKGKEYDFSGANHEGAKGAVQGSAEMLAKMELSVKEQRKFVAQLNQWVRTIEELKVELRSIREMSEEERVSHASKFMTSDNPVAKKVNKMLQSAQSFANYSFIPKNMAKDMQTVITDFHNEFINGQGLFVYAQSKKYSKGAKTPKQISEQVNSAKSITVLRDKLVDLRKATTKNISATVENMQHVDNQLNEAFAKFVELNKKKGIDPLVQMHQVKEKMIDNSRWLKFVQSIAKVFRLDKAFDRYMNKKAMIVVNKAVKEASMEEVHVPGIVKLNNVYKNEKLTKVPTTPAVEKAPELVEPKQAEKPKKKVTARSIKKGMAKRLKKVGVVFKGKQPNTTTNSPVEVATVAPKETVKQPAHGR